MTSAAYLGSQAPKSTTVQRAAVQHQSPIIEVQQTTDFEPFAGRSDEVTIALLCSQSDRESQWVVCRCLLCSNVYREAYDVMVKGNRVVKVTSIPGLPLRQLLNGQQVPIISSKKSTVDRFEGYVLTVDLGFVEALDVPAPGAPNHELLQPCNLMILHRDIDIFCTSLIYGDALFVGYAADLHISIEVAPVLSSAQSAKRSPSLQDYFSKTTQTSLLAPFRTKLRGIKTVKIHGHVNRDLALAVQRDMNSDRWSSPKLILAETAAAKEKGTKLFQQCRADKAGLVWQGAASDIDTMIGSTSWPTLTKRGGERFISQLAELYFVLRLNVAHVQIATIQGHVKSATPPTYAALMADDTLNMAVRSLKRDYWMNGYKYEPGEKLLAKLQYRFSLLLRLRAQPDTADIALTFIDGALRSQPGDAAILKEKQAIMAWKQASA